MAIEAGSRAVTLSGSPVYSHGVLGVVEALLAGEDAKWPELVAEVHALAITVCEKRQAAQDGDFASNVALRVVERLRRENYKALRRFVELRETYPSLGFEKWTRGIINNALVDEVRSQPETSRRRTANGRELSKRTHVAYEDEQHGGPASTSLTTRLLDVRRIVRWIHEEEFPSEQRDALLLWLNGHSIEDCSRLLELDAAGTRRLLQAARQRLRRQFKERS